MTRKYFELVAHTIKTSMGFRTQHDRQIFALDMAHALKETNPNFDVARFVDACLPKNESDDDFEKFHRDKEAWIEGRR
tara:strand:+ start:167 stop:400 length:234 start_codon:yes stop_codon:yes gene_type:complete